MQYYEYELYSKWLLEEDKSRDGIVLVVTFRACLDSWPTSRWQYKPPSPHHLPASPKLVLGSGVTLQTKLVTKTSTLESLSTDFHGKSEPFRSYSLGTEKWVSRAYWSWSPKFNFSGFSKSYFIVYRYILYPRSQNFRKVVQISFRELQILSKSSFDYVFRKNL